MKNKQLANDLLIKFKDINPWKKFQIVYQLSYGFTIQL
jgi:hypothetical protein